MNKFAEIFIGFLASMFVTFIGSIIYLYFVVKINPFEDFNMVINSGSFGKVVVMGSLLNLLLFWVFINKKKYFMARGSILAVIFSTILTQIV